MGTVFVKVVLSLLQNEENEVYKKPKFEIKKGISFPIVRKFEQQRRKSTKLK